MGVEKFFGTHLGDLFFNDFYHKILNLFSPVEHSICYILGMVGPIDVR